MMKDKDKEKFKIQVKQQAKDNTVAIGEFLGALLLITLALALLLMPFWLWLGGTYDYNLWIAGTPAMIFITYLIVRMIAKISAHRKVKTLYKKRGIDK